MRVSAQRVATATVTAAIGSAVALAFGLWLASSTAAAQQTPEQEVAAVENARIAATQKRDAQAVAAFIADDFMSTSGQGRVIDRAQYLDNMRANPAPIQMHHNEVLVRAWGNAAVITGRADNARADGTPTTPSRFTHVYIKRNGRWQMVAMHTSTIAAAP
jgi:ketosteroid isomerase-like protein